MARGPTQPIWGADPVSYPIGLDEAYAYRGHVLACSDGLCGDYAHRWRQTSMGAQFMAAQDRGEAEDRERRAMCDVFG